MSKAIYGAGLLVAAGVATVVTWGAATPLLIAAIAAAASLGVTLEASAIAQSLADNRGMGITTRQAAGLRQIIYGTQRVGGTVVYQSTTGVGGSGGNYVYNYVIAVATHQIDCIQNLYLDGRQVYWSQDGNTANVGCGTIPTTSSSAPPTATATIAGGAVTGITASGGTGLCNVKPTRYRVRISGGGGSGAAAYATLSGGSFNSSEGINQGSAVGGTWTVTVTEGGSGYTSAPAIDIQGLYTFGGAFANDQQDPSESGYGLGYGIAPGGPHYQFQGLGFCEARWGDQPPSDYMASLTANDASWPSTANLGGVSYIYLNIGYNTTQFPQPPEIRMTVNGKNTIYDPRTGTTGYSTNWALQVADVITDPELGLNDGTVDQAQLIAAANICDESVPTSQGNESRYVQCLHYDTGTAPGDVLAMMMPAAGGRWSRIGGEWYIFPAAWTGPSISLDDSYLIDSISWTPYRKFRDLFNHVCGTYVAPNYPYSAVAPFSNLYDSNGWYYGTTENLWNYAFQPTNYPQYAQDTLHGYSANEWLVQDGGIQLPYELTLRGVPSIVQAQRLAKIALLRNRFQGSGTFPMGMAAWQMQPLDVMAFTFAAMGWSAVSLEVTKMQLVCQPVKDENGDDGAMALSVSVSVQQTDPTIYEWDEEEELLPTDIPALGTGQIPYTPWPPSSFTVTSSAATAIWGADGNVIPRALLNWTAPQDNTVVSIDMQYQMAGASAWLNAGTVDVALFEAFIGPLIAGQTYNFQIRSVRANGKYSEWIQALGEVISITLSTSVTSGYMVAPPGTLVGQAESGGTADILVSPFTASVGNVSVACLTAGVYILSGLAQNQLYFVYYIDPDFHGGAITPIATQNENDFLNKLGYFLIGSLVTPSGGPAIYRPSTYQMDDNVTTTSPQLAFDGNQTTYATLSANGTGSYAYDCECQYYGFTPGTLAVAGTLNVSASVVGMSGSGCTALIEGSLDEGSTYATLLSSSTDVALTNYTMTAASGTPIGNIIVRCTCSSSSSAVGTISMNVHEIYLQ